MFFVSDLLILICYTLTGKRKVFTAGDNNYQNTTQLNVLKLKFNTYDY